ncbi:MAG: arginine--tRNA ligase [Tissierellia bacterium]|nr:arginine--tRNA ligase [Tissierellia bacterium]
MDFKKEISKLLAEKVEGMDAEEILASIEIPPNKEMGDYSFPCFRLAKAMRKAPNMISQEIADNIKSDLLKEVRNVGPYVNFFVNSEKINEFTLKEIFEKKDRYGSSDIGKGKNVLVEYSSTNIAKPFHIGHIRSTVIGDSIKKIFQFMGYNVTAINYLGDFGTQFGILLAAYKRWGDDDLLNSDPIRELLKLYVRFNDLKEEDESVMEEGREWFRKLESNDSEAVRIWTWFKEISLKEFNRVYDMLNIEFDSYDGEHFHSQFVGKLVEELTDKKLLIESEDAMIIDLSDKDVAPAIILKRDGSSTYITRDIATAIYRKEKYDFDKNIYVVATQQNLHFKQLKYVLEKMGYEWFDDCEHVSFGMVSLADGTLATRKGKVVFLEDVLNQSVEKTKEIIEQRNPNLENKDSVAKQIGIGAVKFQELFNTRIKDYTFDWNQVLNFDGETGPYVQYAYARANSILNRLGIEISDDIDYSLLATDEEKDLVKSLYNVPSVIVSAMEKLEPSIITRHVTEVAKYFNKFYNSVHIVNSEDDEKHARALLVYATKVCISNMLTLLGIETPEKM